MSSGKFFPIVKHDFTLAFSFGSSTLPAEPTMNQGMYDLMMRELRESRERFDAIMAEIRDFRLPQGNGTLRDESEYIEREFRDKSTAPPQS